MSVTLYTAPDCMRCKIVKKYLKDHDIPYDTVDFKEDAEVFNKFYRDNRKAIYRNPEGVEFPLYRDDQVIKQGSGEVLAWLLGGHKLGDCVGRSALLHGKISGLYPSRCPKDEEENFITLIHDLVDGGLEVWLDTDGRNPALLEKLLAIGNVNFNLNIVGGEKATMDTFGGAPTSDELARTAALLQNSPKSRVRFLAVPLPAGNGFRWAGKEEAEAAAKAFAEASGKPTMPFGIEAATKEMGWDMHGLAPMTGDELLKCRSGARKYMYKADII